MTFRDIVELIKAQYQLDTDYKAIKIMQVSHGRAYKALQRNSVPDDDVIYQCEKLLDYPEGYLLLEMQAQRTKCPEASKILHRISKQLIASAASVLIVVTGLTGFSENAEEDNILNLKLNDNIHYAE